LKRRAFTRAVSPRLAECQLTHLERTPIDVEKAIAQHAAYERALADAGFEVIRLPELPDDPDAVFVEDTAIILHNRAIITRPGAASRAGETQSTAEGLRPYFRLHHLPAGTLDGGDVLRIGHTLFVGLSSRTNMEGAEALQSVAKGYNVITIDAPKCLHLKSAVSWAGKHGSGVSKILVNRDLINSSFFTGRACPEPIFVTEAAAANCVRAGDRLIMPAGNPKSAALLRDLGFHVVEVDVSELQKAEAGVTCMSLISDRPEDYGFWELIRGYLREA